MLPNLDFHIKIMETNKWSLHRKCSSSWVIVEEMKLPLAFIGKYYVVKSVSGFKRLGGYFLSWVYSFQNQEIVLLIRLACNKVFASLEMVILAYSGT